MTDLQPLLAFVSVACAGIAVAVERSRRILRRGADPATGVDNDLLATIASYRGRFGSAIRARFHLDWRFTHLNHGSYGTAPKLVTAAAHDELVRIESFPDAFFRRTALPSYRLACSRAAAFVGSDPNGTVLIENATSGVNIVLGSLTLAAGDGLLINDNTYNACKNAVNNVAARVGAEVVRFSFTLPVNSHDELIAQLRTVLQSRPPGFFKFVLLDHITSPTAIVMPVREMVRACIAAHPGVLVMIDGAHAPGQLTQLNVRETGAHYYTGNLHKWCFTMKGVAVLCASADVVPSLNPLVTSHFWKQDLHSRFFMQGTMDFSRYLSIRAALDGFLGGVCGGSSDGNTVPPGGVASASRGVQCMHDYNSALARAGAQLCCAAWDTHTLVCTSPEDGLCAPFLIPIAAPLDFSRFLAPGRREEIVAAMEGRPAADLAAALLEAAKSDDGINERVANALLAASGIQAAFFFWVVQGVGRIYVRISAQVYNTLGDYKALAAAMAALAIESNR